MLFLYAKLLNNQYFKLFCLYLLRKPTGQSDVPPEVEANADDKAKPVKFSIEGSDEHLDSPQIVIDPPSKAVSDSE